MVSFTDTEKQCDFFGAYCSSLWEMQTNFFLSFIYSLLSSTSGGAWGLLLLLIPSFSCKIIHQLLEGEEKNNVEFYFPTFAFPMYTKFMYEWWHLLNVYK